MSGPANQSPMAKALAASTAATHQRLRMAASKLNACIPSHGVVFDRTMRTGSTAPVDVVFRWPGTLMILDPVGGEIIRESHALNMNDEMPAAAAFMARKLRGKPLVTAMFQPPQSVRMRATLWPDGVVRVHAVKDGDLLAESEPGQPTLLRSGFCTLTPQDLAPSLS